MVVVDLRKQPAYLGTWLGPQPQNDQDPAWFAWGVFNGSADMVTIYAAEAARIRGLDYSDYRPEVWDDKVHDAIAIFARDLLTRRKAQYTPTHRALMDSTHC